MKICARTLAITAVLAVVTMAYGAELNRQPPRQTTTPGVIRPVVPPTTTAVPPIAPVTPVPQVAVPPTQTPIMPTAPVVVPTDPVTIPQPEGDAIQGTTPPQ
jgi:hypothetical protein